MIFRIFISSVQREFSAERKALASFIRNDAILSKFFEVFIFEEVPAQDRPVAGIYLDEVDNCDIYLGLHGGEYGNVDKRGVSATQREYERAEKTQKQRICFIRKADVTDARQQVFLSRIDVDVVRNGFSDYEELKTAVYAALARFLESKDMITRCADVHLPRPRWSIEDGNDFKVVIERQQTTRQKEIGINRPKSWPKSWPESWPEAWPKTNENKILSLIYFREMSKSMLASKLNVKNGSNSLKVALQNLLEKGYVERTLPDKPCSRNQKYRLTNVGRDFIIERGER